MKPANFIGFLLVLDIFARLTSVLLFPETQMVINATITGLVLIIYVVLNLPFYNFLSMPKGEFTTCVKWLLVLSIVGGTIGIINGHPLRYVASDVWKFLYIPFLYGITLKCIKEKAEAVRVFRYAIVWGLGTQMLRLISRDWAPGMYLPIGAGMPYIGILGIVIISSPRSSKTKVFLSFILVITSLLLSITSGRRHALFLNVLMCTLFFFIAFSSKTRNNKGLVIMILTLLTVSSLYMGPLLTKFNPFLSGYFRQMSFFQKRFEDQSAKAILLEKKDIIISFLERENLFKWTFGLGCGALWTPRKVYVNVIESKRLSHNIHMTPIAIFYRHGLLGVFLLIYMGFAIFKSILEIRSLFPQRLYEWRFTIGLISSFLCFCAFIWGIWGFHLFNPISQLPLPIYMTFLNEYVLQSDENKKATFKSSQHNSRW